MLRSRQGRPVSKRWGSKVGRAARRDRGAGRTSRRKCDQFGGGGSGHGPASPRPRPQPARLGGLVPAADGRGSAALYGGPCPSDAEPNVPTFVALLRAVNVGGHNRIRMPELAEMIRTLGYSEVLTHLQSGNVVFRGRPTPRLRLEEELEGALDRHLRVTTTFLVRTSPEWNEVVRRNPFPQEANEEPGHLLAIVLQKAPDSAAIQSLMTSNRGPEVVRVIEDTAYVHYPSGTGPSPMPGTTSGPRFEVMSDWIAAESGAFC